MKAQPDGKTPTVEENAGAFTIANVDNNFLVNAVQRPVYSHARFPGIRAREGSYLLRRPR
jgi:hypothetical protein